MTSTRVFNRTSAAIALTLATLAGCNAIVGLDKIQVTNDPAETAGGDAGGQANPNGGTAGTAGTEGGTGGSVEPQGGDGGGPDVPMGDCTTNQECTDRFSADSVGEGGAAAGTVAGVCVQKPVAHCVKLLSEDCDAITGDYLNNGAIVIGSLFSTKGTTAPTNLPRQQAAMLGVEQINAGGGIPANDTSSNARPLVMVSCDESTNLVRAANHLVTDLHVPAIVGPNTSQDTIDVSNKVTVPGGAVVMSPTGVASSIAALADKDLTWLMVPTDVQRAPLMVDQLHVLEAKVDDEQSKTVAKLGIVYRNDALGIGTRSALNDLVFNGKSLADPLNLNKNVQIDPYNGADTDQQALVAKYLTFQPDIIVLAGTAEAITKVMVPLEAQWSAVNRPYYVLIDSTKVPELLTAVTGADPHSLRTRIRGTGITPGPTGTNTPAETLVNFQVDYGVRYNGASATISGMGPAHDAAYSIGLALAATRTQEISGASVAQGLRKLAGGTTILKATAQNVPQAIQKLAAGDKITAVGTFGMLDWDADGAVQGGTLEMWCIGVSAGKPAYASSGLTFDIKTQMKGSAPYVQCPPAP